MFLRPTQLARAHSRNQIQFRALAVFVASTVLCISAAAQTVHFATSEVSSFDANVRTFDVLETLVNSNDDWIGGAIKAVAMNGTQWYYNLPDPNSLPTAPGSASPNRFSTFCNNPRSQFANLRFTVPTAFQGSYLPETLVPVVTSTQLNVTYNELPPDLNSLDTNAAVARISLDLRNTPYEGWNVGTVQSSGALQLAQINVGAITILNGATFKTFNFNLWGTVPEPTSLSLFLIAVLFHQRRR